MREGGRKKGREREGDGHTEVVGGDEIADMFSSCIISQVMFEIMASCANVVRVAVEYRLLTEVEFAFLRKTSTESCFLKSKLFSRSNGTHSNTDHELDGN